MIQFKCPTCQTTLKILEEGAGSKINCPKCGQRMLVPSPAKPAALPAGTNKTMLGQLALPPAPGPSPIPKTLPAYTESDNLVHRGFRKGADVEGGSKGQHNCKPARSWPVTLCTFLALALAIAAMPAAAVHHPLLGASLAACGVALALFAACKSLFRKGLGLATIALLLGGSVLFSIVMMAGGPKELLQVGKDRAAVLASQQAPQERMVGEADRPAPPAYLHQHSKGAEEMGNAEPTRGAHRPDLNRGGVGQKGSEPKRQAQRKEEDDAPPNQIARHRQTLQQSPNGAKGSKEEERPAQPKQEPAPPADKGGAKPETKDDKQPQFDPDDLQRTARWGCAVVDKLWQHRDNAIRYRDALEKLSKEVNAHEGTKVRWGLVVVQIREDSVLLRADLMSGNTIRSKSGKNTFAVVSAAGTDRIMFGRFLALAVGQGISRDKAAQLKPGDKISVSAKVAELKVGLGAITVFLKDLQLAEEGKQPRGELQKGAQGETAIAAGPKRKLLPAPAQQPEGQPQTKAQLLTADAVVERRLAASEEELRKQMLEVPELRLVNDLEVQAFRNNAKGKTVMAEIHQAMVGAGIQAGLPLRGGAQSRLQPAAALVVDQLSKSLRDLGFVSGVPSPGARRSLPVGQENRPLDKVAEFQKWCDDKQIGKANAALPTLLQMLQVEKAPLRLLLVRELSKVNNRDATIALTYRVLFDPDPGVRDLAVKSLEKRSSNQYLPFLLKALRYPWPPVADRAAQALRKLKTTGIEKQLITLLEQPSPSVPVPDKKGKKLLVPELVRLNHMRNCLLCHAPSTGPQDGLVRGRVPIPGEALPPMYYAARSGDFVRADTTFLRQDFSAILTVEGAHPWPAEQRFDFVVRTREAKPEEMPSISAKPGDVPQITNMPDGNYPQREAVLYALRGLTGKDAGTSAKKWREMLAITKDNKDTPKGLGGASKGNTAVNKTATPGESVTTKKGNDP